MTTPSSNFHDITTINYTLSWPYLEHPSNTTFAGLTQIDICKCGSAPGKNLTDLGHLYTRYRCSRPEVSFGTPDDELWVLHAPLGQVNLLRPARPEEIARREELHGEADPAAYAGKNFLLLTGPCPRGRYQAFATIQYLRSLPLAARHRIECLSILIQSYEEDCSDDQGGRAYIDLAQYILAELPSFKTLCLNIWGEETRLSTREFGMVLWREGVKIVVSWDWSSERTEEYTDVEDFLRGIEAGRVEARPPWEELGGGNRSDEDDDETEEEEASEDDNGTTTLDGATDDEAIPPAQDSPSSSRETLIYRAVNRSEASWEEVPRHIDSSPTSPSSTKNLGAPFHTPTQDHPHLESSSEDDWSDAILTPISPNDGGGGGGAGPAHK